MDQRELRRLASLGAAARLEQLERERAELLRLFPGLRRAARTSTSPQDARNASYSTRSRKRRMSAANRKAVSQRMKLYWAERRKAKARQAARG